MIIQNDTNDKKGIICKLLNDLTNLSGVSADERCVSDYIEDFCNLNADKIFKDNFGNLFVYINSNKKDAKNLLIEAHMDRIGLIVSGIDETGNVKFNTVGGIDLKTLPYSSVIFCNDLKSVGVIMTDKKSDSNEKDIPQSVDDFYIFTGKTKEEVSNQIKIGSFAYVSSPVTQLSNDILSGGAMDNRSGITAVLSALQNINKDSLKYNVILLFTTEEELGLHGGRTAVNNINDAVDAAVIVDVTHGLTPDAKDQTGVLGLSSGAIICRGPSLDHKMSLNIIKCAKENNIPYDIEVASSHSGTDAWALQVCNGGIPCTMISIPLKYMHTNVETLSVSDIIATSNLLEKIICGGIHID